MTAGDRQRSDAGDAPRSITQPPRPTTDPTHVPGRTDLDVPYAEKDAAKHLGARWDPDVRRWYVPPGMDIRPFARWSLPGSPAEEAGPTVRAQVLALSELCYRCRRPNRSVVGVLVSAELTDDPDGFIPFDDVAEALAARLDRDRLAVLGVGELKRGWSGVVKRSYTSNGCRRCGALQGSFPLQEALIEHRAAGGTDDELAITEVLLPVEVTRWRDEHG